jgi:hypothetical protein
LAETQQCHHDETKHVIGLKLSNAIGLKLSKVIKQALDFFTHGTMKDLCRGLAQPSPLSYLGKTLNFTQKIQQAINISAVHQIGPTDRSSLEWPTTDLPLEWPIHRGRPLIFNFLILFPAKLHRAV